MFVSLLQGMRLANRLHKVGSRITSPANTERRPRKNELIKRLMKNNFINKLYLKLTQKYRKQIPLLHAISLDLVISVKIKKLDEKHDYLTTHKNISKKPISRETGIFKHYFIAFNEASKHIDWCAQPNSTNSYTKQSEQRV